MECKLNRLAALNKLSACLCTDRAQCLVTLFDDLLQQSEHIDLDVFQLLLLGGGVCYTCPVGGLCLFSLNTHTVVNSQLG